MYSALTALDRQLQNLGFYRDLYHNSRDKINLLQNEIDSCIDLCNNDCSYINRKDSFRNAPNVQDNLYDDDVISYIMGFHITDANQHQCVLGHRRLVDALEMLIENEANLMRNSLEEYERLVISYISDVNYFEYVYGTRILDNKYKFVDQNL